jgi:micrococcal nuclease
MKKRLAGSALMAASLILAIHPGVMKSGNIHPSVQISKPLTNVIYFVQVPVTWVETVDGDTIKVKLNGKVETIRYLLIDTPESKKPGMCVQPYATEASQRNNFLVHNGKLTLEFEQGGQRDAYGRLLAYVYANGQSVQETLLKEGFARVAYVMDPPYKYLSIYEKGEALAKRNKARIWSTPNYVTKWGFNGCVR